MRLKVFAAGAGIAAAIRASRRAIDDGPPGQREDPQGGSGALADPANAALPDQLAMRDEMPPRLPADKMPPLPGRGGH